MNSDLRPPNPLAPGALRVTALGGISEIGRNMTVFEHLGRLLIIDCGVLFPGLLPGSRSMTIYLCGPPESSGRSRGRTAHALV